MVAVLACVDSRMVWRPGDPDQSTTLPWGLLLGVAASVSVVLLARAVSRQNGFAAAGGWVVGLLGVLVGGRSGSYLIASDGLGYGFLVAASTATVVSAAWAPGRR